MADGLEAIFLENRDALLRFLEARGAGPLAEDLLQEVWIKCAASLARPIANPRSYIFRIAHNLLIDRHRARRQREERERDWSAATGGSSTEISDAPSAERILIARHAVAKARKLLSELGEPTATIFMRFRLDGDAQKQIAQEFGVSLATIEKHLQKAYKAMVRLKNEIDTE
jgi:RNA polymerase sigma factor (sigma-70 family)